VFVPWLYFFWRKQLPPPLARRTFGLFLLGGLQGFVGWYMVQSGLVHEPRVSHYRLALHLSLAFLTGALVLWLALGPVAARRAGDSAGGERSRHAGIAMGLIALLCVQTVYGAFMAGTRAGYYYGTFPDMHGQYLPGAFFTGDSALRDAFTSPPAIHYLHRLFGWLTLLYALFAFAYVRRADPRPPVRRAAALVLTVVFVQFNLGALTVIRRVELPLAVLHQVVAYVLVSAAVLLLHRTLAARVGPPSPA
jgi:heme a synthase